jgi:hypothetical protein
MRYQADPKTKAREALVKAATKELRKSGFNGRRRWPGSLGGRHSGAFYRTREYKRCGEVSTRTWASRLIRTQGHLPNGMNASKAI